MAGAIGWYRKDFQLPESNKRALWVVRFESVNYRAKVWLNGQPIGTNTRRLPAVRGPPAQRRLKRRGVNRLVDARRQPPPRRPTSRRRALDRRGVPTGGWWNYGGILREVYLRQDRPHRLQHGQSCGRTCRAPPAPPRSRYRVDGAQRRPRRRSACASPGSFGARDGQASARANVGPRRVRDVHASAPDRATRACGRPAARPLQRARSRPRGRAARRSQQLHAAQPASARSGSLGGQAVPQRPPAELPRRRRCTRTTRRRASRSTTRSARQQLAEVKELGATMIRAHYPLHPVHAGARRRARASCCGRRSRSTRSRREYLEQKLVRDARGAASCADEHRRQRQPPVGDRLVDRQRARRARPGPVQGDYIERAATRGQGAGPDAARRPRRRRLPVGRLPGREYAPLDVIGINDYFGWYPGPSGQIADRDAALATTSTRCAPATRTRRSWSPSSAPRPTATARSRRRAPTQFQQDFVELPPRRLRARSRGCRGAIYWAMQEFRVRPGLGRRQPAPQPADPREGPASPSTALRKPAFVDVQRIYRGDQQIGLAPAS